MKGKFVVFDGMDGSGKGTQIELLKKVFSDVVFTREPGGPPLAEEVRKIVRDNPLAGESTGLFHFLGFWMAREESVHKLVMPALNAGKHVFSDRGDSSTFAFQLFGEEQEGLIEMFAQLRSRVFFAPMRRPPDLYVIFDLPAEVARERALRDATRVANHFDVRNLAYYKRVREGFIEFAKHYQTVFVDASQTPEKMDRDVRISLAARGIS